MMWMPSTQVWTQVGLVILWAPVALTLLLTVLNMWTWPRGRKSGAFKCPVSILIPARNEEDTIEACVRAACTQEQDVLEVIVFDDDSSDETPTILKHLCQEYTHLRVIRGKGVLPKGWVGKPHACHQLAHHAQGEILCFLDADTILKPQGLWRVASLFEDLCADLVTVVPKQKTASWSERLIIPLLHLTYTSWFPIFLTWKSADVRFLAANGQVLAITRKVYEDIGGFEAVRGDVVDDMAICRKVKARGYTVVFGDGHKIAHCRMYKSFDGVCEGFSKNIYEGLGNSLAALSFVLALYSTTFVLPYIVLVGTWMGILPGHYMNASMVGVTCNIILRALLCMRFAQPILGIILHPLAVSVLMLIALNSWRWSAKGSIRWSGRTYNTKQ